MAQDPLAFQYDDAPQRSPQWLDDKRGKIGASRLGDWLAVSKAKNSLGKPLKPRLDYEKELMFERQFGTSFETYVNSAMQEGIDFEAYAADQYGQLNNCKLEEVGCWYNDFICVSPDRKIASKNAGIEIKIVKDNTFTDVLMDGVPDKHYKQIQGQLWATGWDYIDYVALNFNTKRFVVIRVEPDTELIDFMKLSVQEQLVVEPFALDKVHEIKGEIPDVSLGAPIDRSDSNTNNGGW
jgi:hypothetical protein